MTTGADPRQRRYERQTRLADIGLGGQVKLCAAKVAIRSQGFARTIEHRYVVASGMTESAAETTVDPSRVDRTADVTALGLRNDAARDVAEGALRALSAIRIALGDAS